MSDDLYLRGLPERTSDDEHNRARAYVQQHAPDLLEALGLLEER